MGEDMGRKFQHLKLNQVACAGLRESIRPLTVTVYDQSVMFDFCTRLYLAHYQLEQDPDLEYVDFECSKSDVMLINHFVSSQNGKWAEDVLHQSRQVLYELTTNRQAVRLASSKEAARLLDGVRIDLEDEGEKA